MLAKAASGEPTRLLTLTVNPQHGESPADRLRGLSNAWRLVVKRLRRANPGKEVEFLAIVEETKAGEPHLHILLRSPFVPQALISEWMRELIDAPIVDIRRVKNAREVIRYVAKYVTKAPKQFDRMKRYWSSGSWEEKSEPPEQPTPLINVPWHVVQRSTYYLISDWLAEKYTFAGRSGEVIYAAPGQSDGHYLLTLTNLQQMTRGPDVEGD